MVMSVMQENEAEKRAREGAWRWPGAALKWVIREGLSKKVMLEQTPVGGERSWGTCRMFSAEGLAGAQFLRVQCRREARVLPVWLVLGEWVVGGGAREIVCMARGWWWKDRACGTS